MSLNPANTFTGEALVTETILGSIGETAVMYPIRSEQGSNQNCQIPHITQDLFFCGTSGATGQ